MNHENAFVSAAAIFTAASSSAIAAPIVSSTFDVDDEGWTAIGDVWSFTHQVAGGNPGGHMPVNDAVSTP